MDGVGVGTAPAGGMGSWRAPLTATGRRVLDAIATDEGVLSVASSTSRKIGGGRLGVAGMAGSVGAKYVGCGGRSAGAGCCRWGGVSGVSGGRSNDTRRDWGSGTTSLTGGVVRLVGPAVAGPTAGPAVWLAVCSCGAAMVSGAANIGEGVRVRLASCVGGGTSRVRALVGDSPAEAGVGVVGRENSLFRMGERKLVGGNGVTGEGVGVGGRAESTSKPDGG